MRSNLWRLSRIEPISLPFWFRSTPNPAGSLLLGVHVRLLTMNFPIVIRPYIRTNYLPPPTDKLKLIGASALRWKSCYGNFSSRVSSLYWWGLLWFWTEETLLGRLLSTVFTAGSVGQEHSSTCIAVWVCDGEYKLGVCRKVSQADHVCADLAWLARLLLVLGVSEVVP